MSLYFNGKNLETLFTIGDQQFSVLNSVVTSIDVPGRDGTIVRERTFGPSSVSFTIAKKGTVEERRQAFSTLGQWLNVTEPKNLQLPGSTLYYKAVPSGTVDIERTMDADVATLTFDIVDPAAYGQTKTATVPSGGNVSITVGGTYPTYPTIAASAAVRDSSSKTWGVRKQTGEYLCVDTGSDSSRAINFNGSTRKCTVAGATKVPTITSTWFSLPPGTHTITNHLGSGATTITWVERWL